MKQSKLFIFLLLFLLSFSLALATTININEAHVLGEIVVVQGTCDTADVWVGLEYGFGTPSKTISVDQVTAGATKKYSATYLPPQVGTYTVWASCQGEANVHTSFCVGDGCTIGPGDDDGDDDPETPDPETPGNTGSGSGVTKWECSNYWSVCNVNLTQSRTCFDKKYNQKTKVESRECTSCVESWTCSLWSDCENAFQTRTCIDEHYCGTNAKIPIEQRSCEEDFFPGPVNTPTDTYTPPTVQLPASIEPSFWDQYKWYFFWSILIILIIALSIFIYLHFFRKKKAYNIEELKAWVKQEKVAGTTNDNIRHILKENTGWMDEEIDTAFASLKKPPS
ncbi:hypothetical protein HON71_01020 [Candidatus Woesearchaeota archaeon]|jgi:hypothetical protein|nr:hypothetical protein [Candidatus Woesearchaeota archaeon]MBT5342971.1 hypothetical protein [Candidatus Woesearchaeota archaeon]